jgi:hypothetical protein
LGHGRVRTRPSTRQCVRCALAFLARQPRRSSRRRIEA